MMAAKMNTQGISAILFSVGLLLLSSCATTADYDKNQVPSDNLIDDGYSKVDARHTSRSSYNYNPNADRKSNISLADMVRQLPGVMAAGRPGSWSFKVRGAESLYGGSLPLFVLDGRAVGTDFNAIANTLDANQVKYMRVLTGADAAIYGTRGANGVIVIKMKNKT